MKKRKIAIIYHYFQHYRKPVVLALSESLNYEYVFIGSDAAVDKSINKMEFPDNVNFIDSPCRKFSSLLFQSSAYKQIKEIKVDGIVLLGNPWFLSYWNIAIRARMLKIPVWMWTHGWINSNESVIKKLWRNLFYKLANGLMLYGNRAKELGIKFGFNRDSLYVIGNSLDYQKMSEIYLNIEPMDRREIKKELGLQEDKSIIVCSARLTKLCRFDLLIKAVSKIEKKDELLIVLIGDGEEKDYLTDLAEKQCVNLRTIGACYEEELLAKYYFCADVTVSPGKVGLTAMHSMTYGTPVISHDNFDMQMPEFEAIIPGTTGDFFKHGDVNDLAKTIGQWINIKNIRPSVTNDCRNIISERFTAPSQVKAIERAFSDYWQS